MKKRVYIILTVCLALIAAFVGYKVTNKKVIYVPVMADRIWWPADLADLESKTDLIVQVRVLPGSKNIIDLPPNVGYTLTEIQITNVLEGDIKVGDILTITEDYIIKESLFTIRIFHADNYIPSTPGKEYVFFLDKSDKEKYAGTYYPQASELGRYSVLDGVEVSARTAASRIDSYKISAEALSNKELNLGSLDSTEYREFYADVIDKYYSLVK